MKPVAEKFYLVWPAAVFLLAAVENRAQQLPVGRATDFTSNSYFEPPNDQKVKMKLSGAQVSPLPGGLEDVKQLHIETFDVDGKLEMVVRAPQCNYAPMDAVANSAGHLDLQTGDGKIHVDGEGFLWKQNESLLTVSNHVHTVIQMSSGQGSLL